MYLYFSVMRSVAVIASTYRVTSHYEPHRRLVLEDVEGSFHFLAERFGSGDGERKTLLTRQIAFEPLPASVLFALVGGGLTHQVGGVWKTFRRS